MSQSLHSKNWYFAYFIALLCLVLTAVAVLEWSSSLWFSSCMPAMMSIQRRISREARVSQRLPQAQWRQMGNSASQHAPSLEPWYTHTATERQHTDTFGERKMTLLGSITCSSHKEPRKPSPYRRLTCWRVSLCVQYKPCKLIKSFIYCYTHWEVIKEMTILIFAMDIDIDIHILFTQCPEYSLLQFLQFVIIGKVR